MQIIKFNAGQTPLFSLTEYFKNPNTVRNTFRRWIVIVAYEHFWAKSRFFLCLLSANKRLYSHKSSYQNFKHLYGTAIHCLKGHGPSNNTDSRQRKLGWRWRRSVITTREWWAGRYERVRSILTNTIVMGYVWKRPTTSIVKY